MAKPLDEAIRRLQAIADEALRCARMCLRAEPPMVRLAAFHAQQAAEKELKAWLVALGVEEPQTIHDLLRLQDLATARGGTPLPREPLRFLTEFAIRPRYGLGHLPLADAERAVREATDVTKRCRHAVALLLRGE